MTDWPYEVRIKFSDWPQVQDWCQEHIGEFDKDWYKLGIDPAQALFDGITETVWLFKTQENATLFSLKWL